jgi:hypothetical protein
MIPTIARNTIIWTCSIAVYGFIDFHKFMKTHKRKDGTIPKG